MRLAIFLLLMLPCLVAQPQTDVWGRVSPIYNGPQLNSATLTSAQQRAIARLIVKCCESSLDATQGRTLTGIIRCLSFQDAPLAPKQKVLLISGCFHGGSGGGGPIWLVRMAGGVPILLASPEAEFNGWIYSIQPSVSHGYHDLVLGWHMSAEEAILTYFQFDGTSYISVSRAADLCVEGNCRIDSNIPPDPN